VFENRVLRKIFGPKKGKVTGGWRKLHNEKLRNLYSSPSVIRMIKSGTVRLAGHVARMGKKRNAYRILVGKPEGQRPYDGKHNDHPGDLVRVLVRHYVRCIF
jgi:hypothetical protein